MTFITRFVGDEAGATAIEYALIAGGIALAIIASVQAIGPTLSKIFSNVEAGF